MMSKNAGHSFMDMVAGEAEQYAAGHTSPMSPLLEETLISWTTSEKGQERNSSATATFPKPLIRPYEDE